MFRFRKIKALVAFLAAIAMAGLASPARADFEVQFSYGGATITIDGTTSTATVSGGASISGATITYGAGTINVNNLTVSTTGTTGGFVVNATIADTNSPNTGGNDAEIDMESLKIVNNTGATSTLSLAELSTGFTSPTGLNGSISSSASATISANVPNGDPSPTATVTLTSYLDTSASPSFGSGQPGTSVIISLNKTNLSGSSNNSSPVSNITSPYSLSEVETVQLSAGAKLTDGSTETDLVTPAPGGFVLAIAAMPVVGLGWLRRRRRAA